MLSLRVDDGKRAGVTGSARVEPSLSIDNDTVMYTAVMGNVYAVIPRVWGKLSIVVGLLVNNNSRSKII